MFFENSSDFLPKRHLPISFTGMGFLNQKLSFTSQCATAHKLNALRMHIDDRDTCYFKEIAYFDAY